MGGLAANGPQRRRVDAISSRPGLLQGFLLKIPLDSALHISLKYSAVVIRQREHATRPCRLKYDQT